ncbi:MAG: glutamate synthase-related protein, partial [bacterium]|nr:glutamate synthase-related protein [bacterium]
MAKAKNITEFIIERDERKCIKCQACVRVCANDVHSYDEGNDVFSDNTKCVGCHFCEDICPTSALTIRQNPSETKKNANWTRDYIYRIVKQAETGGIVLTGMGNDKQYKNYFEHIVLNAAQVTNPSIDPLREPMELRTFIGRKPDRVRYEKSGDGRYLLKENISNLLQLEIPVMFSAMSFGSISLNACKSLAMAASSSGIYWNTGEGGLHKDLYPYAERAIVQIASGRFGVNAEYLNRASAVEIKIGQGAKPGIGGHLPGEKVSEEISLTRMIPEGTDAISPAPHHDIYSIEDLRQLIFAIKEATSYKKPVGVKIAAVHNVAPIASGIVRAGADFVTIDGIRGGTGAAPMVIRDNVGIPIELAVAVVDQRLREEGIRNQASVIAAGGFKTSADIIKAIALGADAVY